MENPETLARPLFKKIVLIGVGLIGGSFALALKQAKVVTHVVGVERDPIALQRALALGIVDSVSSDLSAVVPDADLVLLATPVAQTTKYFAGTLSLFASTHDRQRRW